MLVRRRESIVLTNLSEKGKINSPQPMAFRSCFAAVGIYDNNKQAISDSLLTIFGEINVFM